MKFTIKHEIKGRMRVHLAQQNMSFKEADTLLYSLYQIMNVTDVKVYETTCDAVIHFAGSREPVIEGLRSYRYEDAVVPQAVLDHSGRELNAQFKDKLLGSVVSRIINQTLIPLPVRNALTVIRAVKYIRAGLLKLKERRLEVEVLDGTAIAVSLLRRNFASASSIMFMLSIGELLEDWTQKKSVNDLAGRMSLNIEKVWLKANGEEVLVSSDLIEVGDEVIVRIGNVIPFDGEVSGGMAMVNQASLTGESEPVKKKAGKYVYAGTVVEEGELAITVKETTGDTRYEKIVAMIEDSQLLKSQAEGKASRLADKLVPLTLVGTGIVGLVTGSVTKALAVLMVDYSCALKLAMPITVLSAIREASMYHIMVKGGKFLEAVAEADTIVFDKTGTLTQARPKVKKVIPVGGEDPDEMLRVAACLEEHFPHSMAKAVVQAASDRHLEHEEMHSKVEYIVAHGIATKIDEDEVIIGSYHFVFEDTGAVIPAGEEEKFANLPKECSLLYLAIEGVLKAVVCVEDSLRAEAEAVITSLRHAGFSKIVMMTGDSDKTAAYVAGKVGVDEYYSEVLPEDKANYVERLKEQGRRVVMVGDGINDSPALSASDVGIAISDGAEIAREIADITISADNLFEIVTLKMLSDSMMKRIRRNYRLIVGINTGLIALGVGGMITPATSAFLHNASTLAISVESMSNLLN